MTVLGAENEITRLAGEIRTQGLRTGVYLGSSGKLAKWPAPKVGRGRELDGTDVSAHANIAAVEFTACTVAARRVPTGFAMTSGCLRPRTGTDLLPPPMDFQRRPLSS